MNKKKQIWIAYKNMKQAEMKDEGLTMDKEKEIENLDKLMRAASGYCIDCKYYCCDCSCNIYPLGSSCVLRDETMAISKSLVKAGVGDTKQAVKDFADYLIKYAQDCMESGYDGIGAEDIRAKFNEFYGEVDE